MDSRHARLCVQAGREEPGQARAKVAGCCLRSALIQPVTGETLNGASRFRQQRAGNKQLETDPKLLEQRDNGSIDPLCTRVQHCTIVTMIRRTATDETYERRARFATFGVAFAAALIAIAMNRMQAQTISKNGSVGSRPVSSVVLPSEPTESTISGDATVSFG